jgi:hypothetical protein
MKIRSDFVTNSSSSSFIIGYMDETSITIESVYESIRQYYMEFKTKVLDMIAYIRDNMNKELKICQYPDGAYFIKCDLTWDDDDELEETFGDGINHWMYWHDDSWVEWCETYDDYKKYWTAKIENSDDKANIHAPFTLIDYVSQERVPLLHLGKFGLKQKSECGDATSSTLEWYFNYAEDAFNDKPYDPKEMHCNRGEYNRLKKQIKAENIPTDKACLYLLGRILIKSESGNIPEYVVTKLEHDSEYACNHMG